MEMVEIISSIKSDLGGDIISLAISDETITLKVNEALRKVGAYAPNSLTASFGVTSNKILMPEGTIAIQSVLSTKDPSELKRGDDEVDVFSPSTFLLGGSSSGYDPLGYIMKKTELESSLNFLEVTDWYYLKDTREVFLNYYDRPSATVKYLKKFTSVEEITSDEVVDLVKNYALALCKIIEGNIRRKLSQTPGAMVMDGSELVQEGREDKTQLEEQLKTQYSNLIFGIRA